MSAGAVTLQPCPVQLMGGGFVGVALKGVASAHGAYQLQGRLGS